MKVELPMQPEACKIDPETLHRLLSMMEEMANQPKEEMGKRQPGERCMYEIGRSIYPRDTVAATPPCDGGSDSGSCGGRD